jgi:hypothetical protein
MRSSTDAVEAHERAATKRKSRPRVPLLHTLGECVVLPAIAVVLPWRLAFRGFRALAARGRAFERESERALGACRAGIGVDDDRAFLSTHALTRVVDHVDPVLSFFRGERYLDRHVRIEGDPLPDAPCLFIGFHYGTAFWTLRHLRRQGRRAAFLAARVTARQCAGDRLRLAFMRFRKRCVERGGGAPVIFVGGSRERIVAALRAGTSVVGLIDVPDVANASCVSLLGFEVRWPDGLLRLAEAEGVPTVAFVAALDAKTGERRIAFHRLPEQRNAALPALATILDDAIRRDAAAWHLWAEWPRFVVPRASQTVGARVEVG